MAYTPPVLPSWCILVICAWMKALLSLSLVCRNSPKPLVDRERCNRHLVEDTFTSAPTVPPTPVPQLLHSLDAVLPGTRTIIIPVSVTRLSRQKRVAYLAMGLPVRVKWLLAARSGFVP